MQRPERCRFGDGRARSEPRQYLRIRLQCPGRLSIARILAGHQLCPLRTNEPGSILLLAHRSNPPLTLLRRARRAGYVSGGVLQNACGKTPFLKILDREFRLVTRNIANARAARHAEYRERARRSSRCDEP